MEAGRRGKKRARGGFYFLAALSHPVEIGEPELLQCKIQVSGLFYFVLFERIFFSEK
uniref:Uncharacterized protein n=1 Tax=Nelumbo nucifera TaxID=4432 RepID=A0A822Z0N6_NELNU|nr:TPA_asm: hypothetical protein HUJ06_014277 [Nelumbo nucifera]